MAGNSKDRDKASGLTPTDPTTPTDPAPPTEPAGASTPDAASRAEPEPTYLSPDPAGIPPADPVAPEPVVPDPIAQEPADPDPVSSDPVPSEPVAPWRAVPDEARSDSPTAPLPPPEPTPEPAPTMAAPPAKGGNPLMLVLGGVVAAGIGFVAAQVVPQGWPLAATQDQIAALETRLAAQDRKLAEIAVPAVDPALADRLTAIEARLADLPAESPVDPQALAALQAEVSALRDGSPDLAPLQSELAALRAELASIPRESGVAQELEALRAAADAERAAAEARAEAMRAEAESLRTQAAAAAQAAVARGAILRVQGALDAGGGFDVALADLVAAGIAVPPALSSHAEGVPTLAELQAAFPDAAREALAATATPEPDGALTDRLGAFLREQTGLRSTTPRAGSDPDAILSRAEAALRTGDLAATLAELDQLPPEATRAMADWRAMADTRAAAAAALSALADDLNAQ